MVQQMRGDMGKAKAHDIAMRLQSTRHQPKRIALKRRQRSGDRATARAGGAAHVGEPQVAKLRRQRAATTARVGASSSVKLFFS